MTAAPKLPPVTVDNVGPRIEGLGWLETPGVRNGLDESRIAFRRAPGLENDFRLARAAGVEGTFPHVEAHENRGGTRRPVKCRVT